MPFLETMKISHILGLNARTALFSYPHNSLKGKRIARSKILTARLLKKEGIPVPEIYKKFKSFRDILEFDWESLPNAFALKPSKGLGGEGIIVVKKRSKDKSAWITTDKKRVTVEDLKMHVIDILEGAYSLGSIPDVAFIQEYVGRHKAFRKYAYRGTPDIRVVVFNKVPVMAMLRLPTKESGGRANLHQGAIGVGIDVATGITTKAIHHGKPIYFKPGTKRKLNGIKIPHWDEILSISSRCQEVSGLGYLGVDIVLHPEKGPMVLELNSQPGLQIQLANQEGLRKRLERVDELRVRNPEHAVNIAKALFSESFADRVKGKSLKRTISAIEQIVIKGKEGKKKVIAKIDTGAWRTSISEALAEELGLLAKNNILWTKKVKGALGEEERPIIGLTFWLGGRKIITPASIAKRASLKYPVIIGRKNLRGLLVDPDIYEKEKMLKLKKS